MGKLATFAKRYLLALGRCLWSFSLGVLTREGRDRIATLAQPRRAGATEPTRLPEVALAELLPDPPAVSLVEPEALDGNVSLLELLTLAQLVKLRRPLALFEIGTFDGRTTLNLARNAPEGARVHTLDLPQAQRDSAGLSLDPRDLVHIDKPVSGARFAGRPEAERIEQLLGDSARFDYSPWKGRIDLVFVDGSHHADYVRNDTRVALELLRSGGLLLWHDYGVFEGVTQVLEALHAEGGRYAGIRRIGGTSLALLEVAGAGRPGQDARTDGRG